MFEYFGWFYFLIIYRGAEDVHCCLNHKPVARLVPKRYCFFMIGWGTLFHASASDIF
jgi:hypothetical protein